MQGGEVRDRGELSLELVELMAGLFELLVGTGGRCRRLLQLGVGGTRRGGGLFELLGVAGGPMGDGVDDLIAHRAGGAGGERRGEERGGRV